VTTTQSKIQLVDVFGKGARGRIQQGTAADRMGPIYRSVAGFTRTARNLISWAAIAG
jgi:hypothetical protein